MRHLPDADQQRTGSADVEDGGAGCSLV